MLDGNLNQAIKQISEEMKMSDSLLNTCLSQDPDGEIFGVFLLHTPVPGLIPTTTTRE